ncbi:MAG: 30S ribosomal protein S4 [bacterium]
MDSKMKKQCSQCRRAGIKLFLKGEKCYGTKCALIKRNFPSGEHGLNRRKAKKSVYGKQLAEKQRAKEIYGLRERQFSNYLKKANEKKGDTGEHLLNFLESRLDNIVFRMGLVSSRSAARQLVNHGHVVVNSKKVDIPSFRAKVGDVVSIKENSKKKRIFEKIQEKLAKNDHIPSWLAVNPDNMSGKMLNAPTVENPGFDMKSIIEFYSRKI